MSEATVDKKCDESRSFLKTVQVDSAGTREILYLYTLLDMSDCRLNVKGLSVLQFLCHLSDRHSVWGRGL
jgi:hypothetical protein